MTAVITESEPAYFQVCLKLPSLEKVWENCAFLKLILIAGGATGNWRSICLLS